MVSLSGFGVKVMLASKKKKNECRSVFFLVIFKRVCWRAGFAPEAKRWAGMLPGSLGKVLESGVTAADLAFSSSVMGLEHGSS